MKRNIRTPLGPRAAALCLLALFLLAAPPAPARQKMKAADVITKHLEAVGPAESRQSVKSRVITGDASVTFSREGLAKVTGPGVIASSGEKYAVGMVFGNVDNYPHEKFGYDGKSVTTAYVRPGARSPLGHFLLANQNAVKHGLFFGALSSAWPLYREGDIRAKLDYAGLKKIGDRQVHEVRYEPKGGSDLTISLFFDAETFHHVRTVYTHVISPQMGGSVDASGSQSETRTKLTEDFSDFKKEGALTLPHAYSLRMERRERNSSYDAHWEMKLSQFAYNQTIDAAFFDVGAK